MSFSTILLIWFDNFKSYNDAWNPEDKALRLQRHEDKRRMNIWTFAAN